MARGKVAEAVVVVVVPVIRKYPLTRPVHDAHHEIVVVVLVIDTRWVCLGLWLLLGILITVLLMLYDRGSIVMGLPMGSAL